MINEIKKGDLSALADALIGKVLERKNPFDVTTIVFHNAIVEQWFKSYFLKKSDKILMNVDFSTLSSFVNDVLNDDKDHCHILTASEYREYIVKALLEIDIPFKNYYMNGCSFDGIKLYEFADKLSTIIFNMEFDSEELTEKWQIDVYKKANEFAKVDNCFTPKQLYIKNKGNLTEPKGKVYIFDNSFITELYKEILNTVNCEITLLSLNDTQKDADNVELYATPSKKREIERLHTDIFKKIEDGNAFVGDFTVYAPNINEYSDVIQSVFYRSAPGFPEIPFRVVGENKEKHDMLIALKLLYNIANKGFFTRYDFQQFVNNVMVMRIWDLDNDDVDAFMKTVMETNTHRNGDNNDDWVYLKNRLLISMLSDGETAINSGKFLTYTTIDMDVFRINKLIDIINLLNDWVEIFNADLSSKMLSNDNVKKLFEILDKLFANENKNNEEKNFFYIEVKKECAKIEKLFDVIPASTFLLFLKDAPNKFTTSSADVFASGVTFLSLDIDNIVTSKYVYVLGLSSNNFPRVENKIEIDYSKNHKDTYCIDKEAFGNLLKGSENVSISFPYIDLKTGEEFFPSIVIPDIVRNEYEEYIKNDKKDNDYKVKHIVPLDENRILEELYTYSSILNKKRFENIGSSNIKPDKPSENPAVNKPIITTNQIKDFLQNTIVYKYKQLLRDSSEDNEAKEEEFEILDLKQLNKYSIIKEMILAAVAKDKNNNYQDWDDIKDDLFEKMTISKKMPKNYGEEYFNSFYEDSAKSVIDEIKTGYEKINLSPLDMNAWTLETNTVCFYYKDGKNIFFIEPREKSDKPKNYLAQYVSALSFVAHEDQETDYCVTLIAASEKKFKVCPQKAKELLNALVALMLNVENLKYMDIEFVDSIYNASAKIDIDTISEKDFEDIEKIKIPPTISKLLEKIGDGKTDGGHDSWKYFNDQILLDPESDFGYENPDKIRQKKTVDGAERVLSNLTWEMFEEYKKMSKLILYYDKKNTED